MRLLVAQDEIEDSATIERRMIDEGFEVDIVTDGETALWRAREGAYAAIILDILLPKINGYLIRKNRQPKYIPLKISPTKIRPKPLKGFLDYEFREILLSSLR